VKLYLVDLVDPVKKENCDAIKFHLRSNRIGRRRRWMLDKEESVVLYLIIEYPVSSIMAL